MSWNKKNLVKMCSQRRSSPLVEMAMEAEQGQHEVQEVVRQAAQAPEEESGPAEILNVHEVPSMSSDV